GDPEGVTRFRSDGKRLEDAVARSFLGAETKKNLTTAVTAYLDGFHVVVERVRENDRLSQSMVSVARQIRETADTLRSQQAAGMTTARLQANLMITGATAL